MTLRANERGEVVMVEPGAISPDLADRPLVLALDIGSSSVRAALHDRLGRTLKGSAVQVPYRWEVGAGGSVRLSNQTLLDVVGEALDRVVGVAGPLAAEVVSGGVSCFLHSIAGLDAAGRPITPVLSWADTTSAGEAAQLRKRVDPSEVHATTGTPIHASYWPARILRLRREHDGIRRWAGFPELAAEALTGRLAVSRSMASGTGLLDRARGTWSEELLAELGVDAEELPAVVGDVEPIGRLAATASRRWPQLAHVSWFAAWGDGPCSNVGLGAAGHGSAALVVGTSGAMRSVVTDPAAAVPVGLFAFRLGAGAIVGGQLSEGGGLLEWTSRLLRRSRASLERAAAEIAPDAHGLTTLPFIFGERGLGYHDNARGVLVGLSPGTNAPAIYRATLESIAYSCSAIDNRLSAVLGEAPAIIAAGGALARSPLLVQVIADSLGREITVARSLEASRRGAALLALHGSGMLADLAAVAPPPVRKVHSDPHRSAIYRAARERRQTLYESILG
jgi:gluconokinase